MKFQVDVEMEDRWAPYFVGMLKEMERLGSIGSSRGISFYADGDGDFHPKFSWPENIKPARPITIDGSGNTLFDAG